MTKITKRGWIEIAIAMAIFVAVAIVTAFFDLEINKALYNPDSLYGQFFAKLAELPTYLTAPVAGSILFYQNFGKDKKTKLAIKIGSVAVVYAGYAVALYMWFWKNFINPTVAYKIVYVLFFAALMTALTVLAFKAVPEKYLKKLFWFAVFLVAVAVMANVIVQIMKILWSRQRFRTMTPGNASCPEDLLSVYPNYNYDGFTPWYIPNLIVKNPIRTDVYTAYFKNVDSDAFHAFPSGHTCAAGVSFALIIIPDLFPKYKKIKPVFWMVPAVYTILVAVSRVVMAAHYLSDTLFGYYAALGSAVLLRWIFTSKIKAYQNEEEPALADSSVIVSVPDEV